MATGRIYYVSFNAVAVAAIQDLISIQSTSGMAFEVHQIVMGQITASAVGNLRVSLKRFSGAYSIGSAGSSVTPVKANFNDSAATVTARSNDTTQTTSGTAVTLVPDIYNVVNGYNYLPAPEDRIVIAPSQAFVFTLDAAPGAGQTTSCTITIKEIF